MRGSALPYWLTLVLVLTVGYGFWRAGSVGRDPHHGSEIEYDVSSSADQEPPLTEFTLTERSGRPFHSKEMDGQVWVASFFFTGCPSACVRLNQQLADLQKDESLSDVRFVSITCDPENDTPQVLSEYADRFHADPQRWLFCTGDMDYVKRIGQGMMKLPVERQTHANYAVVFDRSGKVRGRFIATDPIQQGMLQTLLVKCLTEPPGSEEVARR